MKRRTIYFTKFKLFFVTFIIKFLNTISDKHVHRYNMEIIKYHW